MARMNDRRGRAGRSSMISSSVIAFISSSVYPRYVNSFLRRVSTRPARFRSFRRAAFARPPIFFAMSRPPSLRLQPFRLRRHPADLAAGRHIVAHRRRFPNVLMGAAAMGMIHRIHRDAADLEHRLAEGTEREPLLARFRERLVAPARARNRANHRAAIRVEAMELARRKLNDRSVAVAHHDGLGPCGTHESATVPGPCLDVVDERAFRDVAERQCVPAINVRRAVRHTLADRESIAGDHEDLLAVEANSREGRRMAGSLEDVRHNPVPAARGKRHGARMTMARRSIRWRSAPPPTLAPEILPHQNTPIRMPTSSAENPGFSLMIACFPSRRTNVLTLATFTWKSSSNAFFTWSRDASRRTMNSRRLPSFRFCAGVPCIMFSVFSVTYGWRRISWGFMRANSGGPRALLR